MKSLEACGHGIHQWSIGVDYAERVDAAPDGRLMTGPTYALVDARICITCGAWLSLGETNNTTEALVELRAAELVAAGDAVSGIETMLEWTGRIMHKTDNVHAPVSFGAQAGWLARAIVEHDTHADKESAP